MVCQLALSELLTHDTEQVLLGPIVIDVIIIELLYCGFTYTLNGS